MCSSDLFPSHDMKREEAKQATDVRKLTMNKPKVKAKIIAFSRYRINNDGELINKTRTSSKREEAKQATDVRKLTMNKPKVKAKIIAFSRAKIGSLNMKFVTITFPSGCSDDLCMQCLNTRLTKL